MGEKKRGRKKRIIRRGSKQEGEARRGVDSVEVRKEGGIRGTKQKFAETALKRSHGIAKGLARCLEMKRSIGAPANNCSGPENRDASILVGKHIANAMFCF